MGVVKGNERKSANPWIFFLAPAFRSYFWVTLVLWLATQSHLPSRITNTSM